jgi:hypothetical protein
MKIKSFTFVLLISYNPQERFKRIGRKITQALNKLVRASAKAEAALRKFGIAQENLK